MAALRPSRQLVLALASAGLAVALEKAQAQEPGSAAPGSVGPVSGEPGSGRSVSGQNPNGDPQALSVGVPVRIQDALVTPFKEAIFQTISTNTYVGRHGNGLSAPLLEIVKLGVAPGLGINLGIAGNLGDAGHAGYTVTPSFQYVFNQSHDYIPGFSFEGTYSPRPGTGLSGGTWGLSGQATENLGRTERSPRLHLNFEWNKVNDESQRARPNTFGYGIGLSALLSDTTAVVGDVFYSQTSARHVSQTFVDLGVTHIVSPRLSLSAGGGVGLDRNTPAFRLFLSLSTSFRFLN